MIVLSQQQNTTNYKPNKKILEILEEKLISDEKAE